MLFFGRRRCRICGCLKEELCDIVGFREWEGHELVSGGGVGHGVASKCVHYEATLHYPVLVLRIRINAVRSEKGRKYRWARSRIFVYRSNPSRIA